MLDLWHQFLEGLKQTTPLEFIAVFAGIASVWFSRIENIWVYPIGLINTIIYVYISFKYQLLGEASVNFYYTVMSIYGWILWTSRTRLFQPMVHINRSNRKWWIYQIAFFLAFYIAIYFSLTYLRSSFFSGAIPWADAFASATAFTGMWLMTRKKLESWYWWILTNISSIPLYFVKHLVFTSVYYLVLLIMAVFGFIEWRKRALKNN